MNNNETQNIEEQNLWVSFIQGSDESLETLYRRYFDELYSYGRKWLNNTSLTEDCIQDLFVKLIKSRSSLSATTSVKYYLFRAFRSVVLDKLKSSNRMQLADEPGEHLFLFDISPEKKMVNEQEAMALRERLAGALHTLTPRQREAIYLRYIEGFSYNEVAEAMELTAKSTYKLMARAIDALKDQLLSILLLGLLQLFFSCF